jgi:hypothetical protein
VPERGPKRFRRGRDYRRSLTVAEQPVQRFDSGVSLAVSKLRKRRCSERDLGKRRQPFLDEPLEPAECRSRVTLRVSVREQLTQLERIS